MKNVWLWRWRIEKKVENREEGEEGEERMQREVGELRERMKV